MILNVSKNLKISVRLANYLGHLEPPRNEWGYKADFVWICATGRANRDLPTIKSVAIVGYIVSLFETNKA